MPVSTDRTECQSFFQPLQGAGDGTRYRPSELTRGPWDRHSQHAGPPTALLAREIELLDGVGEGSEDRMVGRITYEILQPVPVEATLETTAQVLRPGRRVDMVEAELRSEKEPLIRARAWRFRSRSVSLPRGVDSTDPAGAPARAGRPSGAGAPPDPDSLEGPAEFFEVDWDRGYHTATEWRFFRGGFTEPGPAAAWMRPLVGLVAGEELSPLQRLMVAADSGNGISSTLDYERYVFINVDLSVHVHRLPEGEWLGLDAITVPEASGVGISDAVLFDRRGPLGRACQTLLVDER